MSKGRSSGWDDLRRTLCFASLAYRSRMRSSSSTPLRTTDGAVGTHWYRAHQRRTYATAPTGAGPRASRAGSAGGGSVAVRTAYFGRASALPAAVRWGPGSGTVSVADGAPSGRSVGHRQPAKAADPDGTAGAAGRARASWRAGSRPDTGSGPAGAFRRSGTADGTVAPPGRVARGSPARTETLFAAG